VAHQRPQKREAAPLRQCGIAKDRSFFCRVDSRLMSLRIGFDNVSGPAPRFVQGAPEIFSQNAHHYHLKATHYQYYNHQ
jgi:hypothetical protein